MSALRPKPAVFRMQPICLQDWVRSYSPGKRPRSHRLLKPVTCAFCGGWTYEGYEVYVEAATVRYPRKD